MNTVVHLFYSANRFEILLFYLYLLLACETLFGLEIGLSDLNGNVFWLNTQEVTQIQVINSQLKADLERRQTVETRQLHKNIKSETKTRTLQFKKSRRISAHVSLSPEQELEQLKEVRVSSLETE